MYLAPSENRVFRNAPAGTHSGILVRIVDLGSHYSEQWEKYQRKVDFAWELPEELAENGKPMLVGNRYSLSNNEKSNLTKMIKGWTGEDPLKGFDMALLLGRVGLVNVVHNSNGDKTYANVASVMPLMKGLAVPKPVHDLVLFDLDAFSQKTFDLVPEYLQKTIIESREYQDRLNPKEPVKHAAVSESVPDYVLNDEIPF